MVKFITLEVEEKIQSQFLEAIKLTSKLINKDYKNYQILKQNRKGDHIWYITDYLKFKKIQKLDNLQEY